jgi:hypothetical protein
MVFNLTKKSIVTNLATPLSPEIRLGPQKRLDVAMYTMVW